MTDCTDPPYVEHGFVAYSSMAATGNFGSAGFLNGADITYACHDYYGLSGSFTQTCVSGTTWSGTLPECRYNRDTEIWFWAVVVLFIVTFVLIVIILIFLCCYFCTCCTRCGKGSKNDSGGGGGKKSRGKKDKKRKSRSRSRDRGSDTDILV